MRTAADRLSPGLELSQLESFVQWCLWLVTGHQPECTRNAVPVLGASGTCTPSRSDGWYLNLDLHAISKLFAPMR